MGKADRIRKQRDKETLKTLCTTVAEFRYINFDNQKLRKDLSETRTSKTHWKNCAMAGIPVALIAGICLGIYIAHTVLRNSGA